MTGSRPRASRPGAGRGPWPQGSDDGRFCCSLLPSRSMWRHRVPRSRSRRKLRAMWFRARRGATPTSKASGPASTWCRVPMERARQYGTRVLMNAEEHAVVEKREEERIVAMARDGAGGATGAPGSLGRVGQDAAADVAAHRSAGRTHAAVDPRRARPAGGDADGGRWGTRCLNGPEDFTMWERCISRGALGSTLPVLYNSGIDITQGPGFVAIRYEMVHDFRVIPLDGRAHLAAVGSSVHGRRARAMGRRHARRGDAQFHGQESASGSAAAARPRAR